MARGDLSPEVRRFIGEYIANAEQLEVLLLLHRFPDRRWKAQDVSKEVYTVPAAATMRLERLVATGFLTSTGTADPEYHYQPANPTLAQGVEALAAAYRADRVSVIKTIFDKGPDPLQSFSDAFRLRGKD